MLVLNVVRRFHGRCGKDLTFILFFLPSYKIAIYEIDGRCKLIIKKIESGILLYFVIRC